MRARKTIIASAIALVLIAAGGTVAYICVTGGEATAKATNKNYAVYKDDKTMGKADAPVVLIEYAAPSCPHCAHFNETVFPTLKKNYIDTGKVLYILRVYPIMPADGAAELVARCLPANKYFSFIDFLFRSQPQWDPEYGVQDVGGMLKKLSAMYGIDAAKFDACVNDKTGPDRINRIAQDGQMRYNLNAVPTVVLNGTPIPPQTQLDYPVLKVKIDELLKK